ncbi:MAG: methyltransferase domain-containing protein [Verrucomicrobiales bacterium]|nr:methyltransferase domain-containing protein [Verrucomicrobiales bacterium]
MGLPWLKALTVFGQELVSNPRPIGAACPSSPGLARRVARMVGHTRGNYILEIGAGTGAITAALLRDCVPADRLIAVERSSSMVNLLRQRFEKVRIIEGDACDLVDTLHRQDIDLRSITHVVSSLPLRSLPADQVAKITSQFLKILSHGSHLVQYTYNLRHGSGNVFGQFRRRSSSVVWLNLPPARVELFSAVGAGQSLESQDTFDRLPSENPFRMAPGTKRANASPRS